MNLPTPIAIAGAGLCLLGGYLIGVVAGPDTPERTTGTVESFDASTSQLCLTGDSVDEQEGAEDGLLCGTWRRPNGSDAPQKGDEFRFVSTISKRRAGADDDIVFIFGEVTR